MFSVLARHIQKYRQFHRERVKDKLKFKCITACTTTLGNKHCTKYLIISSTSDQKTKILNQKDLGIFCHLKFKNGYFPSDLYIHIWQMVKIHLLEVLLPHNTMIYSLWFTVYTLMIYVYFLKLLFVSSQQDIFSHTYF